MKNGWAWGWGQVWARREDGKPTLERKCGVQGQGFIGR